MNFKKNVQRIIKAPLIFSYGVGLKLFKGRGFQKIWPLGVIRDWLSSFVRNYGRPDSVIFRGNVIFLDQHDSQELSVWGDKHWVVKEIEFIKKLLCPDDTVLDIGANIGLLTIFMSQAVGGKGHVFSFEPAPDNVRLLEKNIKANHLKNVTIVSSAVSDKIGSLKLFLSDFNPGDHRIYNPEDKTRGWDNKNAVYDKLISGKRSAIDVPVISIDQFLKNYERPVSFIKIDVQGAEGGVLNGMIQILKKNPDVKLMTEFWPAALKMFGVEASVFLEKLENLGFVFHDLGDNREKTTTIPTLVQKYTVANNRSTDLFVTRENFP